MSEQTELLNQTSELQANSLEVKYTYWNKAMSIDDFKDNIYYELFINNGSNYSTYWMSSRCVDANSYNAAFDVHIVNSGYVNAGGLYFSYDNEYPIVCAFRPIITLNYNVQIDTENSKDGSTAEQAYVIK